jgi:hypothetical protein
MATSERATLIFVRTGPPTSSAEAILRLLASEGPLCPTQLRFKLSRPERTVREALRTLRSSGEVAWAFDPRDPRRRVYAVARRPA